AENLWARVLDEDRLRIESIPFYVYGVSLADVVAADIVDGRIQFREIVSRGGHSTYRVLVKDSRGYESEAFIQIWQRMERLGCCREVAKRRWIAIDVPASSDVFAVYKLLQEGDSKGIWTFEEAHVGHPV